MTASNRVSERAQPKTTRPVALYKPCTRRPRFMYVLFFVAYALIGMVYCAVFYNNSKRSSVSLTTMTRSLIISQIPQFFLFLFSVSLSQISLFSSSVFG